MNTKKIKEGFIGQQMIVLPPDTKVAVTKNPLIRDLYLTAIGYYPKAIHHDCERKTGAQQYIFLYCTEGKGYVSISKKQLELLPNTYIIIPKNVAHHYCTTESDPWSIYWIHYTGENADLLYERYAKDIEHEVQAIAYDEQRTELFNLMLSLLENNYNTRNIEVTNIKLLQFLSSFIYHGEMYPSQYSVDQVGTSINFMKENLTKFYTIQELAVHSKYSVSHYSDLFKKKTGCSPMQYFNQLKIQKSCQYLYFTDMNIKGICVKMGFDDPYYFSRLFKKLMGISPAKYRNTYKKK